jgi:hypothetical protein
MSWGGGALIFEEEDEAALKARFVELCAKYPDRTPQEVGRYIFQDLRDPGFRGEDAGIKWARSLDIQERIAKARLNGGVEQVELVPSREVLAAETLALARSARVDPKDRIAAYKLVAELEGHITKQVTKTIEDKTERQPPTINFRIGVKPDEDEQAA